MRNKNLELKLIMLCNEIFDFLCAPGNGADIFDINIHNMDMENVRLEKVSVETQEKIQIGKYQIHYNWQEGNLVHVYLCHSKHSILYSKSVVPATQRRMTIAF